MNIFSPVLLIACSLFVTACGTAPGVSEPSIPSSNPSVSAPLPAVQPARLQLLTADKKPIVGLQVRYQIAEQYTPENVWQSATTDAQGSFALPEVTASNAYGPTRYLKVEAEGYWAFSDYVSPSSVGIAAQIELARKTPEELTGTPVSALLFRLNAGISSASDATLGSQFPENEHTRFMTFVATDEAELEDVLNKFKNFDAKQFTHPTSEPVAYEPLMRQALKEGKVLVGYSNGDYFRYGAMVDSVVKSENGYYISTNRTKLLSSRGISGHSYDYEMQVFAFDPNEPITLHTAWAKQTLQPFCRCLPWAPESQHVQYVSIVEATPSSTGSVEAAPSPTP
jgi:hypothetical protein